jgi:hypothetical protein
VTGRVLYVGIPGNDAGALGQEKGAANPAKLFICSARERGEGGSRGVAAGRQQKDCNHCQRLDKTLLYT